VAGGDAGFAWRMPADEWESLSLNYTSGTTGNPKGVVYSHRGATLMCYANVLAANMGKHPVYLWTLPMFHCNGWCFPWTLSAVAGTHVCLRWVRPKAMYDAIAEHKVTHLCGAPVVMSTLLNARPDEKRPLPHTVQFVTAAAPPPEAVLAAMAAGRLQRHARVWADRGVRPGGRQRVARGMGRAGCGGSGRQEGAPGCALLGARGPDRHGPGDHDARAGRRGDAGRGHVPRQHRHEGLPEERQGDRGGVRRRLVHSGDLGVLYPDGYIQLKDRSKDIIISGGENISSIEVEDVLYKHPAVAACAVVAKPDDKWGETPVAFIELRPGVTATAEEIIAHCRATSPPTSVHATWCSARFLKPARARSRSSRYAKRPRESENPTRHARPHWYCAH
jgi:fatty-acyl-CoA synthase